MGFGHKKKKKKKEAKANQVRKTDAVEQRRA